MCFGVRNAPYTFDRLGQALKRHLQSKSIRIIIYYDDILVLASSYSKCLSDAQIVVNTLVELGFYIKLEKCILSPSQIFFFLGYKWDSLEMTCTLPLEKLESIQSLCHAVNTGERVQVKDLQRLLGTIISARPAVALTRAKSRGIQRMVLDHFDGSRSSARKMVRLTKWARQDVQWWLNVEIADCSMSLKSIPIWESSRLATDAMDTAIGSVLEGEVFYEELTPRMLDHPISHKEWLAFELTVTPRLTQLKGKVVTWHVDNTNVRYAWLNSGSVKDIWLCKRVIAMKEKLFLQKTQVVPVYVKSAQHLHADMISRNKVLPDWHLSRQIAERLFH